MPWHLGWRERLPPRPARGAAERVCELRDMLIAKALEKSRGDAILRCDVYSIYCFAFLDAVTQTDGPPQSARPVAVRGRGSVPVRPSVHCAWLSDFCTPPRSSSVLMIRRTEPDPQQDCTRARRLANKSLRARGPENQSAKAPGPHTDTRLERAVPCHHLIKTQQASHNTMSPTRSQSHTFHSGGSPLRHHRSARASSPHSSSRHHACASGSGARCQKPGCAMDTMGGGLPLSLPPPGPAALIRDASRLATQS